MFTTKLALELLQVGFCTIAVPRRKLIFHLIHVITEMGRKFIAVKFLYWLVIGGMRFSSENWAFLISLAIIPKVHKIYNYFQSVANYELKTQNPLQVELFS